MRVENRPPVLREESLLDLPSYRVVVRKKGIPLYHSREMIVEDVLQTSVSISGRRRERGKSAFCVASARPFNNEYSRQSHRDNEHLSGEDPLLPLLLGLVLGLEV